VKRIFLVAGEPSGDTLGARLIDALRERSGDLELAGIGGQRMTEQGLVSLFPMEDLSLIGFVEIVPHLPRRIRRMGETVAAVEAFRPDAVVTIDSPGFNLRLQRRLKGRGTLRIHYVAPQVWAWREDRARHLATDLDHLLTLLPFEQPFFERHGVPTTFVGHPVVEEVSGAGDGQAFRRSHGVGPEEVLLCLLPGSRRSEVSRHLPVMAEAVERLRTRVPDLRTVLPTLAARAAEVERLASGIRPAPIIVSERATRFDAYAASRAGIAASGTISLEVALAGLPTCTVYRTGALTAWLARRLITVPYVNLANLILGRGVVPELLQDDLTSGRLAEVVGSLLLDEAARSSQRAALEDVGRRLGADHRPSPSRRAADAVLQITEQQPRRGP
jgi:lipid-A-disaccharide synthase